MIWTEARTRQLQDLWETDMSARDIAKEMGGITKNSVIGKAHRLGLSMKDKKSKPVEKSKAKPRKPVVRKLNPNWVERTSLVPASIPAPQGPQGGLPIGSLKTSSCRAITGVLALPNGDSEPAYCGADKATDKNWCAHHHALYTQPARNR